MEIATGQKPRPFARLGAALRAAFGRAVDVALPSLCPACRGLVAEPRGLCPSCWSKLNFITRPYCERLGIPFAYDPGPGILSMQAIADPPAFARARAAVRYDDVARELVHAFKYADRIDLAPTLGGWVAIAARDLVPNADALVPVPLHWRRLWARRFNQSAALASVVGRATGLPVQPDLIRRIRHTPQQALLPRAERATNVQGSFRVPAEAKGQVRGRRLILVDDVLSTGATLDACARALLRAGAANVDVLVFARVVDTLKRPI